MPHTDRAAVPNPARLDSACRIVLEMPELLELVLSFLPTARVFTLIRVSKYWKTVIANSFELQYKMFLRLSNKPCELWTVDAKHKLGANNFGPAIADLNDTELTFRRVDISPYRTESPARPAVVKPLTVNPLLRTFQSYDRNRLDCYLGNYGNTWVSLRYHGWIDVFQHNETWWKTYLTDPFCHTFDVFKLNLYFGSYDSYSRKWTPVDVPANMPVAWEDLDGYFRGTKSVGAEVCFIGSKPLKINTNELLTMGDILQHALETPGRASCRIPGLRSKCRSMMFKLRKWYGKRIRRTRVSQSIFDPADYYVGNATMYENLEVLKKQLGTKHIPERAYMKMSLNLYSEHGVNIIVPTDKERAQADDEWESQRGFSELYIKTVDSDTDD